MRPHEAILLCGVRQYAAYSGYGGSFTCEGPHADAEGGDVEGATLVAIDAVPYQGLERDRQYEPPAMHRELTKLWAALSGDGAPPADAGPAADGAAGSSGAPRRPPEPFATGNWGCGVFGGDARLKVPLHTYMHACMHT